VVHKKCVNIILIILHIP